MRRVFDSSRRLLVDPPSEPFTRGRSEVVPDHLGSDRNTSPGRINSDRLKNMKITKITKTFYPYCRLNVFSRNCHNQVQSRKVSQRSSVAWSGVHPPFCFASASSTRIVGVSKTQTSKTQTSDPKSSDPLSVSKTQTLWVYRKLRH